MSTFAWVAIGVGVLVGGAVIIALATPAPGVAVPSNQIIRQQVAPIPGLTVTPISQARLATILGVPQYQNVNT